ncbi:MAG TPA: alpha/beta hydrolase [Acidimicrobiales bacterium]
MPAVFVHGVPETPALWDPLLEHLGRADVTCLRLPGFGAAAPAGFDATKEAYVDWLVDELVAIGEPVDLVGHDWGGGFVARVACMRPDLLRSWCIDVAGVLDPEYVWHDVAQLWQTPEVGEQVVEGVLGTPKADRVARFAGLGVSTAQAEDFVDAFDAEMGRCILALYRSAAQPAMHEWSADVERASAVPGLVLLGADDAYTGGTKSSERMAALMGARFVALDGLGHWWMLQDPALGAALIRDFWATLN